MEKILARSSSDVDGMLLLASFVMRCEMSADVSRAIDFRNFNVFETHACITMIKFHVTCVLDRVGHLKDEQSNESIRLIILVKPADVQCIHTLNRRT
jgi:hypothetical protein